MGYAMWDVGRGIGDAECEVAPGGKNIHCPIIVRTDYPISNLNDQKFDHPIVPIPIQNNDPLDSDQ